MGKGRGADLKRQSDKFSNMLHILDLGEFGKELLTKITKSGHTLPAPS